MLANMLETPQEEGGSEPAEEDVSGLNTPDFCTPSPSPLKAAATYFPGTPPSKALTSCEARPLWCLEAQQGMTCQLPRIQGGLAAVSGADPCLPVCFGCAGTVGTGGVQPRATDAGVGSGAPLTQPIGGTEDQKELPPPEDRRKMADSAASVADMAPLPDTQTATPTEIETAMTSPREVHDTRGNEALMTLSYLVASEAQQVRPLIQQSNCTDPASLLLADGRRLPCSHRLHPLSMG